MLSLSRSTRHFRNPRVSTRLRARKTAAMGTLKRRRRRLGLRLLLGHSNACEFGVREDAERHLPAGGHMISAEQIVADNAEVVVANVRKLRASGHFPKAQTPGAVVSSRSFTLMYPLSVSSTPVSSSPIPFMFGMRPAATKDACPPATSPSRSARE